MSNTNNLLIQSMDKQTREVSFSCCNAKTGNVIFRDFQMPEKFFIGVEEFYNDIIYFHKYRTPEMPNHKGIYAVSAVHKKLIWENEELEYYFLAEDKIVCRNQKFDSWQYNVLEYETGKILNENLSYDELENLRKIEHRLNYTFPNNYKLFQPENNKAVEVIENLLCGQNIIGFPEYVIFNNCLVLNIHQLNKKDLYDNLIFIVDLNGKKTLYSDKINSDIHTFVPDSFFIKDDLIIILKNKNEVKVLQINE